jgi:hypothetical protein
MIELEEFVGIPPKDVAPRARLFFRGGQHIRRHLAGKLLVRLRGKIAGAADDS